MKTTDLDPVALARRQMDLDRARTLRFPDLFKRKLARMKASPLAFLRGAAPLFYEILHARPELAKGPGGEGWLAGDLHLENFGAYKFTLPAGEPWVAHEAPKKAKSLKTGKKGKTAKTRKTGKTSEPGKASARGAVSTAVGFDLNDFDEAFIGPWRVDVLRLLTSLILGGRELGADGTRTLALCDRLLDAYVGSAFYAAPSPEAPRPVRLLMERVAHRSRLAMLDDRTDVVRGRRRFVRGERYRELPADVRAQVAETFAAYVASVAEHERPTAEQAEWVDCALRVAGTGSLGGLRIAVLARGKGHPDGNWIFDLKEQGEPSGSVLVPKAKQDPAERVVTALRTALRSPPRMLGAAKLGRLSMFGRLLAPQEDKLDLRNLEDRDLDALTAYLGSLTGLAHARAATGGAARPWSRSDRDALLDQAIAIAGLHEAIYLALCRLMREV